MKRDGQGARKFAAIFILISLGIGYYFINTAEERNKIKMEKSAYDQIKYEMYEYEYPKSPESVLEGHNKVINYIYSGNMKEEETVEMVSLLRKYWDDRLVAINDVNDHVDKVKREILKNEEDEIKITGSKIVDQKMNVYDSNIYIYTVWHVTNKGDNSVVRYVVGKTESSNEWKIIGFEQE